MALILIVAQGAIVSTMVQNSPMVTTATVITSPIGPTNILSHKMTPPDLTHMTKVASGATDEGADKRGPRFRANCFRAF